MIYNAQRVSPAHRLSRTGLYFFTALFLFSLTSCGDLEQNLVINADGSGTLETSIDLGEMMSMMEGLGDMGDMINEDVTISGDTEAEQIITDSLFHEDSDMQEMDEAKDPMDALMEKITDPDFDQDYDTLIAFTSIMPDSVREKETRPDLLENVHLRMRSPASSSSLVMGIVINYDDPGHLQEIVNHLGTIEGGSQSMMPGDGGGLSPESFLVYEADLKDGWIRFDSIDYSSFAGEMGLEEEAGEESEDLAMLEMMFGNSKIKSVIHVPGEVTSCTHVDAILTKDNKVIIEHDFIDMIKGGKMPGYTIYFTPKK